MLDKTRLLRLLRPIRTKLTHLKKHLQQTTMLEVISHEQADVHTLNNTSKRKMNRSSKHYGRRHSRSTYGNAVGNQKTRSYGRSDQLHIQFTHSLKGLRDALRDALEKTWCRGVWIAYYGPRSSKHDSALSYHLEEADMIAMPLSILTAFSIGSHLAEMELEASKSTQIEDATMFYIEEIYELVPDHLRSYVLTAHVLELCMQQVAESFECLDMLLALCVEYRLDIQAVYMMRHSMAIHWSTRELTRLYHLAQSMGRVDDFVCAFVDQMTMERVRSEEMMNILKQLSRLHRMILASAAAKCLIEETDEWQQDDDDAIGRVNAWIDYAIRQLSEFVNDEDATSQITPSWRQRIIDLACALMGTKYAAREAQRIFHLVILTVVIAPELTAKIETFWCTHKPQLKVAAKMLGSAKLIERVGYCFWQQHRYVLAEYLYIIAAELFNVVIERPKMKKGMELSLFKAVNRVCRRRSQHNATVPSNDVAKQTTLDQELNTVKHTIPFKCEDRALMINTNRLNQAVPNRKRPFTEYQKHQTTDNTPEVICLDDDRPTSEKRAHISTISTSSLATEMSASEMLMRLKQREAEFARHCAKSFDRFIKQCATHVKYSGRQASLLAERLARLRRATDTSRYFRQQQKRF